LTLRAISDAFPYRRSLRSSRRPAISFWRFALTSIAMTAVYLPVILGLALIFGEAAFDRVGGWAYLALIAPVAVACLLRARAAYRRRQSA